MLAYAMDGGPISRPHGAPLRLVMPEMYGYKSVKWVAPHRGRDRRPSRGSGSSTATTRTRGSGSRMASPPDAAPAGRIQRFTRTERTLHWMHASAFFALLATGLILYLPALSTLISRRNLVKNVHIWVAVAWAVAVVVIIVAGNRKRLADDWREIETIDRDDRRWLRGRRAPQGRFNAGQKINALLTVGVRAAVRAVGLLPLARRARPPLPLRRHGHRPRRTHASSRWACSSATSISR